MVLKTTLAQADHQPFPPQQQHKIVALAKIIEFIENYNEHIAKPYGWTYTGKPLAAEKDAASLLSMRDGTAQ